MAKKKIDYNTIVACKAGDSDALNRVLEHFDGMINAAATKKFRMNTEQQKRYWIWS